MYLDADSGKYIVSVFADENVTEEKSVFESSDPLDQKLADQSNNSVTEFRSEGFIPIPRNTGKTVYLLALPYRDIGL